MSQAPILQLDLTVGEALRAAAQRILLEARAAIEDANRADSEAVHDFRRAAKRCRALLRLLGPWLGEDGRRLRRQIGDLARALGGARDAQSALDALDDLAQHGHALSARSLATLRARIAEIRAAAEGSVLTPEARLQLARAMEEASRAVALWPLQEVTFADVAARLARGYRNARRAMPKSWEDADAETLHELRKAIIIHRYQMDLVVPLWRRFGRLWIGEAQRLRSRLGAHQDLLLLDRLTQPHAPLARWRSRLEPAIEQRKAEHVRAARRIARRLLVEKPRSFRRRIEVLGESSR